VTRQAARKVADGLQQRGYATAERDSLDSRQLNITLTPAGQDYARAVIAVIEELNQEVRHRVDPGQLAAAASLAQPARATQDAWSRAPCGLGGSPRRGGKTGPLEHGNPGWTDVPGDRDVSISQLLLPIALYPRFPASPSCLPVSSPETGVTRAT
jgi:hypothetical protein